MTTHECNHLLVFLLASIVGIYLVRDIKEGLHSPLMSITNVISSAVIVLPLLNSIDVNQIGLITILQVILAVANLIGGITITYRMLKMFEDNKS